MTEAPGHVPAPVWSRRAGTAVAWSGLSVVGRQASQLLFAVVLARLLGPETFGVVSLATLYVTAAALVLDQGLSAAVVQRRELPRGFVGATATVNVVVALAVLVATVALAGPVTRFFDTPALEGLLLLLAPLLLLKALAIAPRAVLLRDLRVKPLAVVEVTGAATGAAAGLVAAWQGLGPTSLAVQVLVTDTVVAVGLLAVARGPVPSWRLGVLGGSWAFSSQVFAGSVVAYLSRNLDNVLVARVLGSTALAYYAMAYRVLVLPVQLLGQTVNRVVFPLFARLADSPDDVRRTLLRTTRLLALVAVPPMALAAAAAPDAVDVVLGAPWAPVAPVVAVLALAGARETVFYVTPALMKGLGRGGLALRFELLSTAVQVLGVVVGLRFGVLGVAVGYTLAGVALTPVLLHLQRRLCGVSPARQLGGLVPAVHASAWGVGAYLLLARTSDLGSGTTLALGTGAFALVVGAVLLMCHRDALREVARTARSLRPGGPRPPAVVTG